MKIFITGSKGQLAESFLRRFERDGIEYRAHDIDTIDIADAQSVNTAVEAFKPSVIINCAAYNLVDKAETDTDTAIRANATGPQNLAAAAKKAGAFMVHFGTDYIFDGEKAGVPYVEADKPNPLNVYGKSKLQGEDFVRASGAPSLVLRLSWVFGHGRQNFIFKLREWAAKQPELRITADEVSVPTYTEDIVVATMAALKKGTQGTWHLTNAGFCSRYVWATTALEAMGIQKKVIPVSMNEFKTAAKRPGFSAMSNAALCSELGIEIEHWSEATKKFADRESVS
jgi:dTDP-4-dehydrorhamnose reductase